METMLPPGVALLIVGVLITGLVILLRAAYRSYKNDWEWHKATISQAAFGSCLMMMAYIAITIDMSVNAGSSPLDKNDALDMFVVLGMVVLSGGIFFTFATMDLIAKFRRA